GVDQADDRRDQQQQLDQAKQQSHEARMPSDGHRLSVWPAAILSADLAVMSPARREESSGAFAANRASTRWRSGATVTSPRLPSIAVTTAAPTCSGLPVPISGGGGAPESAYIPAPLIAPGLTTETPTPAGRRSSRRHSAKPRRPNFVAA